MYVMFTEKGWMFYPLTKGQILNLHCIARGAPVLVLRMIPGLLMLSPNLPKTQLPCAWWVVGGVDFPNFDAGPNLPESKIPSPGGEGCWCNLAMLDLLQTDKLTLNIVWLIHHLRDHNYPQLEKGLLSVYLTMLRSFLF